MIERPIIAEFLERTADPEDEISGSLKATITQFIIDELRRCVIDLCEYKERLIKGVNKQ